MPQPLSNVVRGDPGFISIGHGEEKTRPELAALAFAVIARMTAADAKMAQLVASITAGRSEPIITYFAQARNDAPKEAVIKALALSHLKKTRIPVFSALWKEYRRVQGLRNPIAHHLWGTCEKIVYDALVSSDPRKELVLDGKRTRLREQILKAKSNKNAALAHLLEKEESELWREYQKAVMVYRKKDFEDILEAIEKLRNLLLRFNYVVECDAVSAKSGQKIFQMLIRSPEYRALI